MAFKVEEIVNANTIRISPRWAWEGYAGDLIKVKNFNIPQGELSDFIKYKLSNLLLNREVELKDPSDPKKGDNSSDEIGVDVYLNGINILVYFPELKSVA